MSNRQELIHQVYASHFLYMLKIAKELVQLQGAAREGTVGTLILQQKLDALETAMRDLTEDSDLGRHKLCILVA